MASSPTISSFLQRIPREKLLWISCSRVTGTKKMYQQNKNWETSIIDGQSPDQYNIKNEFFPSYSSSNLLIQYIPYRLSACASNITFLLWYILVMVSWIFQVFHQVEPALLLEYISGLPISAITQTSRDAFWPVLFYYLLIWFHDS